MESVGGKRINPAAALHGVPLQESFEAVEHPAEPTEKDEPVRCPPPENSITHVIHLIPALLTEIPFAKLF